MSNLNAFSFFDVCTSKDYANAALNHDLIITAGRSQLHKDEARWIYEHGKYVTNSQGIFQPQYSCNYKKGYSFLKISSLKVPGKKGRFFVHDAKTINDYLGFELLATI